MSLETLKSKGMKNEEILPVLRENGIDVDATPIVIDVVPTGKKNDDGKEWVMVFFLAEIKLKSSNASLTAFQKRVKGWGESSQILRAMEAIPEDTVEEMGLVRGAKVEGTTFRIVDSIEDPSNGTFKATPRMTKKGELLVTSEGNEIYRETQVIDVEELEEIGHQIISCKPVVATSPTKTTTKQEVLQS